MKENRHGAGRAQAEQAEQRTEQSLQVRQITNVQASWTERERGQPGSLRCNSSLTMAWKSILQPHVEDAELLIKLFSKGIPAMFDMERKA
jgi:hypothetical protein